MAKKLEALRDSSAQELEAKLVELKTTLSKEKAQVSSGTRAEKPAKIRNARRQIARILTIMGEKKAKASAAALAKAGAARQGANAAGGAFAAAGMRAEKKGVGA